MITAEEQIKIEEVEQEMKKLNVDIIHMDDFDFKGKSFIGVEVDVDCEIDLEFMRYYALRKKVMRGSIYYVAFNYARKDKLEFKVFTELPEDFQYTYAKDDVHDLHKVNMIGTTFPDLCWIHSEGTTSKTLEEVMTKPREDVRMGDLTWTLPSKFTDDFIEMMHTLNQGLISGIMQDAIIYGPIIYKA